MNRYNFQTTKQKRFCDQCGGGWISGHECPGPKVPTYGQKMPADNGLMATPFQEIWTNANQQMLEDEEYALEEDEYLDE